MAMCSFSYVNETNDSKSRHSGAVTGKLAFALAVGVGNGAPVITVFSSQKSMTP